MLSPVKQKIVNIYHDSYELSTHTYTLKKSKTHTKQKQQDTVQDTSKSNPMPLFFAYKSTNMHIKWNFCWKFHKKDIYSYTKKNGLVSIKTQKSILRIKNIIYKKDEEYKKDTLKVLNQWIICWIIY